MPFFIACGEMGHLRASCPRTLTIYPGRHLRTSVVVHESSVDSRSLERSVCDVGGGGVVLEEVREDVAPRRDV